MSLPEALLVLVFRSARVNRRPNLTAFCKRRRCSVLELERAFELLEGRGLLLLLPAGERLTLEGLAIGAALAKQQSTVQRPLSYCGAIAA